MKGQQREGEALPRGAYVRVRVGMCTYTYMCAQIQKCDDDFVVSFTQMGRFFWVFGNTQLFSKEEVLKAKAIPTPLCPLTQHLPLLWWFGKGFVA